MKIKPLYCCEICGRSYHTVREALACENGHRLGNMSCDCGGTLFTLEETNMCKTLVCNRCGRKVHTFLKKRRVE